MEMLAAISRSYLKMGYLLFHGVVSTSIVFDVDYLKPEVARTTSEDNSENNPRYGYWCFDKGNRPHGVTWAATIVG